MAGVFLSGTPPKVVSGVHCSACHLVFMLVLFFSPSCPSSAIGPVIGVHCSACRLVFLTCPFLLSILSILCYWPSQWSLVFCQPPCVSVLSFTSLHFVQPLLMAQLLPAFQNVSQFVCVCFLLCVWFSFVVGLNCLF